MFLSTRNPDRRPAVFLRSSPHGAYFDAVGIVPAVDIVFLLILFVVLSCHFSRAPGSSVPVPDLCSGARPNAVSATAPTLTVLSGPQNRTVLIIAGKSLVLTTDHDPQPVLTQLTEAVDRTMRPLPVQKRILTLRIDKSVRYATLRQILAAIAKSTTSQLKLAVRREKIALP